MRPLATSAPQRTFAPLDRGDGRSCAGLSRPRRPGDWDTLGSFVRLCARWRPLVVALMLLAATGCVPQADTAPADRTAESTAAQPPSGREELIPAGTAAANSTATSGAAERHERVAAGAATSGAAEGAALEDPAQEAAPDGPPPLREVWDVLLLGGAKIGYARTTVRPAPGASRGAVDVESELRLDVQRFGESAQTRLTMNCRESESGELIEFVSRIEMGPDPLEVRGRVEGDRLLVSTTTAGRSLDSQIDWRPAYRGPYGAERNLLDDPLMPGDERRLEVLMPPVMGHVLVTEVQLHAADYEPTRLPHGVYELLRVERVDRLPDGQQIESVLWIDRNGEIIKTVDAVGIEAFRSTRAEALETPLEAAAFDLGHDAMVQLDRPLVQPHNVPQARYRVRLAQGDPARIFVQGPTQQVTSIDPHTAEVTVLRTQPPTAGGNRGSRGASRGDAVSGDAVSSDAVSSDAVRSDADGSDTGRDEADSSDDAVTDDPPQDEHLAANSFIESDDPELQAMARRAVAGIDDPWRAAVALERLVHESIEEKNFSQVFATAAETARSGEGDCTEHAVLLAALARAVGLPSRVAIGLVYVQGVQSFVYHMWTEVFVDGRWYPLDATLARGGIGAAHLKLAHSSLHDSSAIACFLPVAQVLGRLEIELLEAHEPE